jgi:fructose-1,6-bisphosphatase/inositol monophosphatase family enzyme
MRIVSEEHGQLTTGDQAIATAIIDGLDGSSVYKKQGLDGRYSTMLGVLRGSKPRYKDTMTSGIIEHSRHRLLFSDRNSQTRVRDLISLQEQPVKTSGKKTLDSQTRFYIDDYSAEERAVYNDILLPHFPNTTCGGASATYYIDTALGAADAVIEWTRKNNLEIAVAYQIIQKAGGVMVDRNGNDLGEQLYDEYGQRQGEPVITAATPELAEAIIKLLFTSR